MIGLFHRTFYADANLFHQDSSVRQVIPDQRIHCMSCRWPVEAIYSTTSGVIHAAL